MKAGPQLRGPHHGIAGHPTLLYVGRVSREKSLDRLADAFDRVSELMPEARLVIVGDRDLEAREVQVTV